MALNAVLDVATLRASRRILRPAGVRADAGRFVDIDIAATGQLIEAIVLFDRILVPDIGHREQPSLAGMWGPAVQGLSLTHDVGLEVGRLAADWLDHWCDVSQFATLVGAMPKMRESRIYAGWSSREYLVVMALALGIPDKYQSSLIHWLRHQAAGDQPAPDLAEPSLLEAIRKALARYPKDCVAIEGPSKRAFEPLVGYSQDIRFDPEFLLFFSNLVWTAYRTKYYSLVAAVQEATYFPHPLRNSLAGFATSSDHLEGDTNQRRSESFRLFTSALANVWQQSIDQVNELPGISLLPLTVPCLFPYVLERAKHRRHLLEAAYDVREGRGAVALRARIAQLDEAARLGDVRSLIAIRNEVQGLKDWFCKSIGLDRRRNLEMKFSLLGVTASLPVRWLPKQLDKPFYPTRPHLALLRDSFDALTRVSSLGALHEILSEETGTSASDGVQGLDGWTALMTAVANGSVALVETLASRRCDLDRADRFGLTPLAIAASNGQAEIVEILVRAGADIHARSGSMGAPLVIAASKGHTEVATKLLVAGAGGADGKQANEALSAAIRSGHLETAKAIVAQSRAIEPATRFSPRQLRSAIEEGWIDLVRVLIANGASPDAHAPYEPTPLMAAIDTGNCSLIECLIAAGADLEMRDSARDTALHVAADRELSGIIRLLVESGSDVRAKNAQGRAVLHVYANREDADMVQYLLEHGADPNSKNNRGETALMLAVLKNNSALCAMLLAHGADTRIKNMKGHSAIDLARNRRMAPLLSLLQEWESRR